MDTWFKVGVIAALVQVVFAGTTFLGITYQNMQGNVLSISVSMGIALFTWIALYLSYREIKRAPQRATQSSLSDGDLNVDYAGYGLGPNQYRNVTNQVRSLVKDGELHMIVGPEDLKCEVYSGSPGKHLFIIYSYRENWGIYKKANVYEPVVLP